MSCFTMQEIKEFAERRYDDTSNMRELRRIYRAIPKYVDLDRISHVYPKNLFANKANFELVLFMDNDRIIIVQSPDQNITFRVARYDEIEEIELMEYAEHAKNLVLTIKLKNGTDIMLDSKQDTEFDWVEEYKDTILNIYKSL